MDVGAIAGSNTAGYVAVADRSVAGTARIPVSEDCLACEKEKPVSTPVAETSSGRALEIFRQELKLSMAAKLGVSATAQSPSLADVGHEATPDDVAAETLGAASRFVGQNADIGSYALLRFRQRVQAAATLTQQTVSDDSDIDKVSEALGKVQSGLDTLDERAARSVESSASVLSVDTRQRQRSTIRIRTQEGDIVRLDVKRLNRLSAQDTAVQNENGSATRTEVSASSRSRLSYSVKGDLNEAESAAIRQVFEQAESIANEFFGGDLSAAFSQASDLSFDPEQLARVNLRFRSRAVTNTSYAQIRETSTRPVVDAPVTPGLTASPARPSAPIIIAPTPAPAKSVTDVAQPEAVAPAAVEPVSVPAVASGDLTSAPFQQFFDLLGGFLRGVAEGFGGGFGPLSDSAAGQQASAFTFNYSQSFKLEIFKSVLQLTAPAAESDDAADLAASLIDGISDVLKVEADDD